VGEIPERLARVRRAIGSALARAGDPAREVTIVAVTKTHPASVVDEVAAAGITDIGESRVQEAAAKMERALAEVRWHLVGHLQRNKARRAAELFQVIHSVDSPALVEALGATGRPLQVFLQVNVAGEARKHGVRPEGARGLLQAALRATALEVLGLMTIPPLEEDPRPSFRALRELRDDLASTGDGPPLRALSMGMSSDFEAAIEEGATHIRLGTVLFGARAP
jgi:pyridoxal phosphate enzyme (YggS family)